ncbi:MAG: hypothetical protein HRT58_00870 [Crocinitomicaceae bacterium]|nr:hypothetical protein [Flavobacteriales bacterium]NQZ34174.1 hypothetical protein [Crocinitomicaceae bacterium]
MNKLPEENLSLFEELCAILTGFSLTEIQGTGLSEKYLEVIRDKEPQAINNLLDSFEKLGTDHRNVSDNDLILIRGVLEDECLGPISQQLILMWYTGQWNFGETDTYVISEKAYIESFSFRAAGSHPAGAKQPGFGTWQFPPQTFSEE